MHLLTTREGNACGADGPGDPDINDVDCPACIAVHDEATREDDDDDRGPHAHFQMYSRAGNDALEAVIAELAQDTKALLLLRRDDVLAALRTGLKGLDAAGHPEWHDTEPRWEIVDAVNFRVMDPHGFRRIEDTSEFC